MSDTILQYGALGLLAAVLAAIGFWLRDYLKRRDERENKIDDYLRILIDADRQERITNLAEWMRLVKEDIEAKQELGSALKAIAKYQQTAEARAIERHKVLVSTILGEPAKGQ